jgi:hypothetical protein
MFWRQSIKTFTAAELDLSCNKLECSAVENIRAQVQRLWVRPENLLQMCSNFLFQHNLKDRVSEDRLAEYIQRSSLLQYIVNDDKKDLQDLSLVNKLQLWNEKRKKLQLWNNWSPDGLYYNTFYSRNEFCVVIS